MDTVLLPWLSVAIASSRPEGSNATAGGRSAANDDPLTGVRAPFLATENTSIEPAPGLTSSFPSGLNAGKPKRPAGVANGEPGTGLSAPVELTEDMATPQKQPVDASSRPLGLNTTA